MLRADEKCRGEANNVLDISAFVYTQGPEILTVTDSVEIGPIQVANSTWPQPQIYPINSTSILIHSCFHVVFFVVLKIDKINNNRVFFWMTQKKGS